MKMRTLLHCSMVPVLLSALLITGCSQGSAADSAGSTGQVSTDSVLSAPSEFSLSEIPAYSGDAYTAVNDNIPYFSDEEYTTDAFELYSSLDSLSRCGTAFANICPELMPTEERGEIGSIFPSGWHTVKYNNLIDGNYLYNRCHLIGYQLAGENDNEKNLITGTRYLNVEGMLPFENSIDEYVETTGNHVLYRVTPVFEGSNLLASGVLMEACSVEDEGSGIQFNVYCYNVQPGIIIDYATGDSMEGTENSSADTDTSNTARVRTSMADNEITGNDADSMEYVLNTHTKKFHYPSCSSVSQMKEENRSDFTGSREDLISQGYEPCKNCNP